MENFYVRLSKILSEKRIKVKDLSEQTGISEEILSKYLKDKNVSIDANDVASICRALNVDANYLLGLSDTDDRLSNMLLKLSILANDMRLSVNECMDYYRAKITIDRIINR